MLNASIRRIRRAALAAGTAVAVSMIGVVAAPARAAAQGPCDIYAAGGTPCVAAHSTTRALYATYDGPLYQVRRASDNATRDIGLLTPGGVVNAAAQDAFCAATTCLITVIYDQSGRGNHLTQAPPGGFAGPAPGGFDNLADATAAPIRIGGHKAYGVFVAPGTGYRDNDTNGIATGDQPEGMYAIFDGTHFNGGCCFDYGNAETDSHDDGNGTMEAIYFGTIKVWGFGPGPGPWVMADLENGLFSGVNFGFNANDPTISNERFVTAIIKGEPHHWAIRSGNAQSGGLSTFYDGPRPNVAGYDPMRKQGAIILGTGGDNSIGSAGTFYEGVMTSGFPTNATEEAVQANVTAAGYSAAPTHPSPGERVSLQATAPGATSDYIKHDDADDNVVTVPVTRDSSTTDKGDATWLVRPGLADSSCLTFESANKPGSFLRHQNFRLHLQPNDGSTLFAQDATFCEMPGNSGQGVSFQSKNFPTRYIRTFDNTLFIASNGGSNAWDTTTGWAADTSWLTAPPWAPQPPRTAAGG